MAAARLRRFSFCVTLATFQAASCVAATTASASAWRVDLDVLAFKLCEFRFKNRRLARGQKRVDGPIFHGDEGANFHLAVHDQAQGHGLHASGGEPAAHLVPQQRRYLVAHQAVQHAARLLRVHQILVDFAGMLERGLDCLRRDLVEHHADRYSSGQ